jgi:TonB family protein
LLLAAVVALAPTVSESGVTDSDACPVPIITTPRYPAKELMNNIGGTAVVLADIDVCGRVSSPRISTSSGHVALDEAAIATVTSWVLNPAQRALAKGGALKLPVQFGTQAAPPVEPVPWPKTHRRPRYSIDELPIGFDTIADFKADATVLAPGVFKSPYGSVHDRQAGRTWTVFAPDRRDTRVFWLMYLVDELVTTSEGTAPRRENRTLALARYRLVQEAGSPVVKVAILCEAEPVACTQLQEFLLKGLPIARPPRR